MKNYEIMKKMKKMCNYVSSKRIILLFVFLFASVLLFSQSGPGIAPINPPTGGFNIEGDLMANSPYGDWIQNQGGGVLDSAGNVINPIITRHIIDPYNSNSDNCFADGEKFNGNPTTWHWTTKKVTGKDDINHAMIHFAYDADGDMWFVFAGDRKEINGESYIDFEILQNTLTANSNGTFSSEGTNFGRTEGDILITVQYSNGGSVPTVIVYQWKAISNSPWFDYVQITPNDSTVFAETNRNGPVSVPYEAFGSTIYQQYAFAEAAVNLNDIIPSYKNCVGIKTILIKTKTSTSKSAALKDIIEPIQIDIATKLVATMANQSVCYGNTTTLTPTITMGAGPYTYLWSTSQTTSSINVTGLSTSTYYVTITGSNSCVSEPVSATVSVNPLKIKVFLQGDYDIVDNKMRDDLRIHRYIPQTEPYSSSPYNANFTHIGGGGYETVTDTGLVWSDRGENSIVDWVFIELRDKNNPANVLYTKSALLQRDGDVVDVDGVSNLCFGNLSDQYYIAVRHRNHMGVMTATPKSLNQDVVVNFTNMSEPEFNFGTNYTPGMNFTGLSQTNVENGVRAMWYGDADNNHRVKYDAPNDDQSVLQTDVLSKEGNTTKQTGYDFCWGYYAGDVNMNGKVKYEAPNDDRSLILYQIIFYPLNTTHQSSFDYMIEQIPYINN